VGRERPENLFLLVQRRVELVEGPREHGRDLVELLRRDPEVEAGGTLVSLTDDIELGGIFGLLEPLMARMVRRGYQANLGRLKAILETQPAKGA